LSNNSKEQIFTILKWDTGLMRRPWENLIMNKISLIVSLATLTVIMGGCSGSETEVTTTEPVPQPVKKAPEATKSEPFKGGIEPGKRPSPVASGLIPPTNPDQRVKQIVQGRRNDPFGLIPVQPIVTVDPEKAAKAKAEKVPQIPVVPAPPPVTVIPKVPVPPQSVTKIPISPVTMIPQVPGRTFSPVLPTIPEPTLAKEVAVTGVMDVGGVTYVILQAPNETSSRSVRTGQYISNGQILVKRVEMNRGAVPIVILEQFGIEVSKEVGEEPEVADKTSGGANASLPDQPSEAVSIPQTVPTASVPNVVLIPPKQNS
jgi:hypothetical protein